MEGKKHDEKGESVEDKILQFLDKNGEIADSIKFAQERGWKHDDSLIGTLKRLEAFELISTKPIENKSLLLTEEGEEVARLGSPEARVFNGIPAEGIAKAELEKKYGKEEFKVGFAKAMAEKWLAVDKKSGIVQKKVEKISDTVSEQLRKIKENPAIALSEDIVTTLKKRKLIHSSNLKSYLILKGNKFSTSFSKAPADLTSAMILNESWKEQQFRPYNLNALGTVLDGGHLHPLLKVRAQIREIFLEMGFEEMPTNNFVENSFWNFDTLFQPQQHPARDAHDTFFLSDPAECLVLPEDYVEAVKEMHSRGGYGSIGWRYDWKLEETKKNILRTHTTAVSSRMLYKLAQEGFTPKKYFSIDRVFRNEAMDATHLAEFHQIEGLIADKGLTLGHLMGTISQFFKRLGIENLRFKPAYNP